MPIPLKPSPLASIPEGWDCELWPLRDGKVRCRAWRHHDYSRNFGLIEEAADTGEAAVQLVLAEIKRRNSRQLCNHILDDQGECPCP